MDPYDEIRWLPSQEIGWLPSVKFCTETPGVVAVISVCAIFRRYPTSESSAKFSLANQSIPAAIRTAIESAMFMAQDAPTDEHAALSNPELVKLLMFAPNPSKL